MKARPILFSGNMVRAILAGTKTQTRRPKTLPREPSLRRTRASRESWDPDRCPFGQPGDSRTCAVHSSNDHADPHSGRCTCGDTLWIRETWALEDCGEDGKRVIWQADRAGAWVREWNEEFGVLDDVHYLPSDYEPERWRPSIHMPRWASRLTLEVTEVRVQRACEISEEDAKAEGFAPVLHEHWTAYDPETEGYPSFAVEPDAETIARRRLENVRHHGPRVLSSARDAFRATLTSIYGPDAWDKWVWAVSFRVAP